MIRAILIALVFLTACNTAKISHSSKKEIKGFLQECSTAFEKHNQNWLKEHCSQEVFDQFKTASNNFSDTTLLQEMKVRFSQKPDFQSSSNQKYSIGLGIYSEITGYRGGGVSVQKKDDLWIILKYRYHGK